MAEEDMATQETGALEPYGSGSVEIARMFREAETVINEWLDEADEEGAAIIERARAEAARHAAEMKVSASERIAAALRDADAAAAARRQAAADEAAILLAESRAQAERRLQAAEREASWRVRQAEADAAALEARAAANAAAIQHDVGELQRQLTQLVEKAVQLLPALDAAKQLGLASDTAVAASTVSEAVDDVSVDGRGAAGEDIVDAEVVDAELVDAELVDAELVDAGPVDAEQFRAEPEPVARGLGQLVGDDELDGEANGDHGDHGEPERRRGLGRLLGRR